jgi:taurine dioxygenase
MELEKIAVIGAQVSGIDLCAPLDDATFEDIQSALAAHGVLFFRDQNLSGDQLLDLGRRFGELFIQPVFADQFQELLILTNDEKRPPMLNTFHQDMTGLECPPGEHLLHALVVPDGGGDTIWSCNYSAYEALSQKMRAFLSSLTAKHSILYSYARAFDRMPNGAAKRKMVQENLPPVHHPVARTHPVTGRKGLFVNRFFTECIDDMKKSESDLLLGYLFELIETPEFCVRLRWQAGTLAIWDNRCTSHYALADYYPQLRRMQRASVCGEKPQ